MPPGYASLEDRPMKHKKLFDLITGTVLGMLLGTAVIGCLVTAFDFSVSLWTVGFWCFVSAAVSSFFFTRGWSFAPVLLLAAVTAWLAFDGVLMESVEGLVCQLTEVYQKGYGWPVLRWTEVPAEELAAEMPVILCLLGSLIALCAGWSVCRGQSVAPAILFSILVLGLCFVVTDTVPDTGWIFIAFFAGAMLLLPGAVRLENGSAGRKLTAAAVIPVFLSLLLLFAFVPKNGYNGDVRAKTWTKTVVQTLRLEELWEALTGEVFSDGVNTTGTVDLTQVGSQSHLDTENLRVTANVDGTLYLRGRAYNTYDGRSWTNSEQTQSVSLPWPDEDHLEQIGEVQITTKYAHSMLYLPYYTTSLDMRQYAAGKENEYKLNQYSLSCARLPSEADMKTLYPDPYVNLHTVAVNTSDLIDLPSDTRRWARQTVEQITGGMESYYHIAQAIAEYVSKSADYNLKTGRMPTGETDFARWFLEEGDTGYCIHFATTAAVLLRAADIPARYVTGYLVQVKAGEETVVKDSDAHAWVEYWLPAFGWTVLEATPAAEDSPVVPADTNPVATAPVEAAPAETTAPIGGADPGTQKTRTELPDSLRWVLGVVLFVLIAVFQWRLRVCLSQKRLQKGDTNRQTLARWAALERCDRLLKKLPEDELLALAQKAKFSQYTITEEELSVMDMALMTAQKQLKKKNIFLQIFCTVILAIY